jgi:hypothetical protein
VDPCAYAKVDEIVTVVPVDADTVWTSCRTVPDSITMSDPVVKAVPPEATAITDPPWAMFVDTVPVPSAPGVKPDTANTAWNARGSVTDAPGASSSPATEVTADPPTHTGDGPVLAMNTDGTPDGEGTYTCDGVTDTSVAKGAAT